MCYSYVSPAPFIELTGLVLSGTDGKIHPIIARNRHPCRAILRQVGRALSLLKPHVLFGNIIPTIFPSGRCTLSAQEWLGTAIQRLHRPHTHIVEYDGEDCFLNTPRHLVLPALQFLWLSCLFRRRRGIRFFAISKDGKNEDYIGHPCSMHYWEVGAAVVMAVVQWEEQHNSLSEVIGGNGAMRVLEQTKGLPIVEGHLSAALVELSGSHGHCCWKRQRR